MQSDQCKPGGTSLQKESIRDGYSMQENVSATQANQHRSSSHARHHSDTNCLQPILAINTDFAALSTRSSSQSDYSLGYDFSAYHSASVIVNSDIQNSREDIASRFRSLSCGLYTMNYICFSSYVIKKKSDFVTLDFNVFFSKFFK